jgi:hypothetical protein
MHKSWHFVGNTNVTRAQMMVFIVAAIAPTPAGSRHFFCFQIHAFD